MIIATSSTIPEKRIIRTLGLVRGSSVRSKHLGKDILALFRNLAGGEIPEYTKMMAQAREQAIDRMMEEAEALGADGIIALRFQTSQIMSGAAEMLCYGTAVQTEDVAPKELPSLDP